MHPKKPDRPYYQKQTKKDQSQVKKYLIITIQFPRDFTERHSGFILFLIAISVAYLCVMSTIGFSKDSGLTIADYIKFVQNGHEASGALEISKNYRERILRSEAKKVPLTELGLRLGFDSIQTRNPSHTENLPYLEASAFQSLPKIFNENTNNPVNSSHLEGIKLKILKNRNDLAFEASLDFFEWEYLLKSKKNDEARLSLLHTILSHQKSRLVAGKSSELDSELIEWEILKANERIKEKEEFILMRRQSMRKFLPDKVLPEDFIFQEYDFLFKEDKANSKKPAIKKSSGTALRNRIFSQDVTTIKSEISRIEAVKPYDYGLFANLQKNVEKFDEHSLTFGLSISYSIGATYNEKSEKLKLLEELANLNSAFQWQEKSLNFDAEIFEEMMGVSKEKYAESAAMIEKGKSIFEKTLARFQAGRSDIQQLILTVSQYIESIESRQKWKFIFLKNYLKKSQLVDENCLFQQN